MADDESLRDGDGVGNSRLGRAVIGGMQIWALDPHHLPPPVIPGCRKYLLFTLARASDVASVLQPNIATFAIIAVQRKNKAAEFFHSENSFSVILSESWEKLMVL